MLVNGKLIPPPELGDALYPDEPGYHPPGRSFPRAYLTSEQWDTLREAARVESCAGQQLAMMDAANRMSATGGRLARDFFELHARPRAVAAQNPNAPRQMDLRESMRAVSRPAPEDDFSIIDDGDGDIPF